ncbi:MAG: cell surface protein SprA [Bacteroidales bacterium]
MHAFGHNSEAQYKENGSSDNVQGSIVMFPDTGLSNGIQDPPPSSDIPLPSNFRLITEYDIETNSYLFRRMVGDIDIGRPGVMSLEEYRTYNMEKAMREYWQQRSRGQAEDGRTDFIPGLSLGADAIDMIFGSDVVNIQPQGSAELIFGINTVKNERPDIQEELRRTTTFDFQEKIQMNVTGTIGDRVRLGINYNTEAMFEFENQTKLEYTGSEDEIFQRVEAGNVTLPLPGSLITGSQSLFGLKTEMKFGNLTVTSVFSQQKGESSVIEVRGGAQTQEFEVYADDYDGNRHFFLGHYFRDTYESSLRNLPVISSGVNITRIEVWVTNKTDNFENARNIVAFMDLAENQENIFSDGNFAGDPSVQGNHPRNSLNDLYEIMTTSYQGIRNINQLTNTLQPLAPDFVIGQDYEAIENARKLSPRDFTINSRLGYISLNTALNADEVLAVAFEYTIGGETFRVGEFSNEGISAPDVLIVKLLKGTNLTPRLPTWDLMMKNVYSIGAWQVNRSEFVLNVMYQDDQTGNALNYIPEGRIREQTLLRVMNLDNLNSQLDPYPDGSFDFIEGITIYPSNGRIVFPVLEPFGSHLKKQFGDDAIADRYVFQELYDSTQTRAQQIAEKNKFLLAGMYQSSSGSEIPLNAMNVPRGSVQVTAGGVQLTENVDYTVDYALGRVQIINQGLLESGTPIRISLESQSLFNIQTKTLVGSHFDYRFSDNFNIGATLLNLTERPLTQKVSFGDEPISNTIWGLNSSYRTESRFLTNLVDLLPFIDTRETSTITFQGEFAHLIPGHSRALGDAGVSYIDDFEATKTTIDLKTPSAWVISSTPEGQPLFPESALSSDFAYGYNRALLAWYVIDPLFLRNTAATPEYIKNNPDLQSSHFVREVFEKELFPARETPSGIPTNIPVLNLAYYPVERGPYNYDVQSSDYSAGIGSDGRLLNPESRWGGIMRSLSTTDFEAANIEYVEFWLMDPFIEDAADNNGGDFFINLGNVSEDILKDGRKSFENGLPTSEEVTDVDTTIWGRVPTQQSLVNAFDNNPQAREFQDVGLNGLRTVDERSFFSVFLDEIAAIFGETSPAFQNAYEDPSSDNYIYFRGRDWDEAGADILERYKYYNGMEGNSPASEQSPEPYPTSATTLPNTEDLNRDNTLSKSEAYYQYRISIRPEDLRVGHNYVVDSVRTSVKFPNGEQSSVNWYQFKIPLSDYERAVGSIQDFKSIRFIRMFLTGFEDPVIMRFARLDLVRSDWRQYNLSLMEGQEGLAHPEPVTGTFDVSAVNIEENASKTPVNYVLPPGIDRVIDPTNPHLQQLNEQSMVLKVENLDDGDARAAFKNLNLDIRQFRKIQMEVHAAALPGEQLNQGDITMFIRLGTDYRNNYYEYEIPLSITPPGRYDNNSENDRLIVWPSENRLDIELDIFQQLKQVRNQQIQSPGSAISISTVFMQMDGENRVKVVGNPNLSNVRTMMVGIRNPGQMTNPLQGDDGLPKSGEIWINELRLTNFNEESGWAANARFTARLADLGTFTFAGLTSQPGFGSIEKKVNERSQEQVNQYDLSTNLELGKFFPEDYGVRIPMYVGYSEGFINPKYNPVDPDVPLRDALDSAQTKRERDSIKDIAQDYTQRKSLNFTNVQITQTSGPPKIYSISNWSLSYAFSEMYGRNISTDYRIQRNYSGGINYNYTTQPKNVTPFSNWGIFNSPVLRLLRDFNFYYAPSYLSFRTDLNRYYQANQLRNINNPDFLILPSYQKDFTWNRFYDIRFDLTRQLRFEFSATNTARIDEPEGIVDRYRAPDDYRQWKDSVLMNLKDLGRTTQYYHSANLTYSLPINKIPFFNWVNITARYNTTYGWDTRMMLPDSVDIDLGNVIKNSNTTQLNTQLNMVNLYNKVGYLERVNQKTRQLQSRTSDQPSRTTQPELRRVRYEQSNVNLDANRAHIINHNLHTEEVVVRVLDDQGRPVRGSTEIVNDSRVDFTVDRNIEGADVVVEGNVEIRETFFTKLAEHSARLVMSVKNIGASYSHTDGTIFHGYLPGTDLLGIQNYNESVAPGYPFIFGYQDPDFAWKSIRRGWMTTDTTLNEPYMMSHSNTFNLRSTIEPIPGFRIDVTASRTFVENMQEYYYADRFGDFHASNKMNSGNFNMTFLSLKTAFERPNSENSYYSSAYEDFRSYRQLIAERLAEERGYSEGYDPDVLDEEGFPDGYGRLSQDVLLPAFIAAYGKMDPRRITLNTFPLVPLPNWRIVYDGLSRIPLLNRILQTANINHAYRSTYSISNYITNLGYIAGDDGFSYIRDNVKSSFTPEYNISSVAISEQFNPLINLDITWNNDFTSRAEIRMTRTVSLSLANNQISEIKSEELVMGIGYRFRDVQLVYRAAGTQRELRSDLNVRADLSVRENVTIVRRLAEEGIQPTAGQTVISVNASADYVISNRFDVRLFFDRVVNKPIVSLSYPTTNTSVGFSLRFTLIQ